MRNLFRGFLFVPVGAVDLYGDGGVVVACG
jgi:hypothetical protein